MWFMNRCWNFNINRNLEEVDFNFLRWLWGVQEFTFEEVTTDVMKIAREPELEAGPKDVTELHHLMIKL